MVHDMPDPEDDAKTDVSGESSLFGGWDDGLFDSYRRPQEFLDLLESLLPASLDLQSRAAEAMKAFYSYAVKYYQTISPPSNERKNELEAYFYWLAKYQLSKNEEARWLYVAVCTYRKWFSIPFDEPEKMAAEHEVIKNKVKWIRRDLQDAAEGLRSMPFLASNVLVFSAATYISFGDVESAADSLTKALRYPGLSQGVLIYIALEISSIALNCDMTSLAADATSVATDVGEWGSTHLDRLVYCHYLALKLLDKHANSSSPEAFKISDVRYCLRRQAFAFFERLPSELSQTGARNVDVFRVNYYPSAVPTDETNTAVLPPPTKVIGEVADELNEAAAKNPADVAEALPPPTSNLAVARKECRKLTRKERGYLLEEFKQMEIEDYRRMLFGSLDVEPTIPALQQWLDDNKFSRCTEEGIPFTAKALQWACKDLGVRLVINDPRDGGAKTVRVTGFGRRDQTGERFQFFTTIDQKKIIVTQPTWLPELTLIT
jgi:hypothetical protein